jgi:DNA-directed RNA polymerase specialized sigma24 family protein
MNVSSGNSAAILKPAQASVIRLVKLRGLSIARASGAIGQSAALVKINIHRGLEEMAALVSATRWGASDASESRVMLREST